MRPAQAHRLNSVRSIIFFIPSALSVNLFPVEMGPHLQWYSTEPPVKYKESYGAPISHYKPIRRTDGNRLV